MSPIFHEFDIEIAAPAQEATHFLTRRVLVIDVEESLVVRTSTRRTFVADSAASFLFSEQSVKLRFRNSIRAAQVIIAPLLGVSSLPVTYSCVSTATTPSCMVLAFAPCAPSTQAAWSSLVVAEC